MSYCVGTRSAAAASTCPLPGLRAKRGNAPPATWSLIDQKPVVNTQLLHWIHHGRIAVVPGITGADGLEVTFTDGRREAFDTIVWCTGYAVVFPFLDHALLPWQDGVRPVPQVRTEPCPGPDSGPDLQRRRRRVADRHHDAGRSQLFDER